MRFANHCFRPPPRSYQIMAKLNISHKNNTLNNSRTFWQFCHHFRFALKNQRAFWIICRLGTDMFDFPFPVCSQIIETQAVFFLVHFTQQSMLEPRPLRGINNTLKYGILHALPIILTCLGYSPKASLPSRLFKTYIITDQYQHITSIQTAGSRPGRHEAISP